MLGTCCRGAQHIPEVIFTLLWVYPESSTFSDTVSRHRALQMSFSELMASWAAEVTSISQGEGNTNRDGT